MKRLAKRFIFRPQHFLHKWTIEVESITELMKVFSWTQEGIISDSSVHEYRDVCDINQRRLRDAEVLATACRNIAGATYLEIGTSQGHGTALMAENSPETKIYTVNIHPDEAVTSSDAEDMTWTPDLDGIGAYYKAQGLHNVEQIIANSATWKPDIKSLDLAFIDGSHQRHMVVSDAKLALQRMKAGGFILFHDFHPKLHATMPWINTVLLGVDDLFRDGYLKTYIYWLRDSWIGLYQIPPR